MTNVRRQLLLYLLALSDLTLLGISLYVSVYQSSALTSLPVLGQRNIQIRTIIGLLFLFFIWRSTLPLLGLYKSKRLAPRLSEAIDAAKAAAVATVWLAAVAMIFDVHAITPAVLVNFSLFALFSLTTSRLVMRQGLQAIRRHGRNLRQVLVVGTNARAVRFVESVLARPELGYRLVGFVDDAWFGPSPSTRFAANLVSNLAGFRSYLRTQVVDEVVIALPIKSFYDREGELLDICQEQGVIVRVLSDLFHYSYAATEIDEVDASPVISFYNIPPAGLQMAAKRTVDIVLSISLILLFSPLMLVALILVKLESKGPVIFSQERIGLNKRRFRIYKFRSMVANAEKLQANLEARNEARGPVFKIKEDPRITRIGKFLRKTSIDELPQLFNVLKGDMSLVGPRPLPVRDYNGFNQDWQRRRFSVRPGVTCLWQIGGRSSISFEQWMRLDMQYIDQWSLWLDMKILVQTVPAVIRGSGAS